MRIKASNKVERAIANRIKGLAAYNRKVIRDCACVILDLRTREDIIADLEELERISKLPNMILTSVLDK